MKDSGRFEMTQRQAQTHVVRLLTIVARHPENAEAYWSRYAFPDLQDEDLASAFVAASKIAGELVAMVESLRQVPICRPVVETMIATYARDAEEPPK
jgi:hypothetical protein